MRIMPFWCDAFKIIWPVSGFPLRMRTSGSSMLWSTLFRMMCIKGSRIASSKDRSISVSAPFWISVTFLLVWFAASRINLGNLDQTCEIDCIRIFIIRSCSSSVSKSMLCTVFVNWRSAELSAKGSRRFLANTISLARFINLSSVSKLIRTGVLFSWLSGTEGVLTWSIFDKFVPTSVSLKSAELITTSGMGWITSATKGWLALSLTIWSLPRARLPMAEINKASSPAGSVLLFSMPSMMVRKTSIICSKTLLLWISKLSWPSRIFPRRDSPAWEIFSKRLKEKKPLLPFKVWRPLKILPINFLSVGDASNKTKSESSWSRISLASRANSVRISSKFSISFYSNGHLRRWGNRISYNYVKIAVNSKSVNLNFNNRTR